MALINVLSSAIGSAVLYGLVVMTLRVLGYRLVVRIEDLNCPRSLLDADERREPH